MVDSNGIFPKATRRLDAHKHIAKLQPGHRHGAIVPINRAGWLAPGLPQGRTHRFWPAGIPLVMPRCVSAQPPAATALR